MAGAPSLPQVLVSQSRAGTLFNTYTTAKRIINDEDALNIPGNYLQLGTRLRVRVKGALSNVATTPGNVFFQVMLGSIVAFTTGNLALNAAARTLLPFSLDIDLVLRAVGTSTTAQFLVQGTFGGVHLTNTDQTIQVPTTAPAVGTGFDSVAAAGNVLDFWAGFSNSQAGNGVQLHFYEVEQLSKIAA